LLPRTQEISDLSAFRELAQQILTAKAPDSSWETDNLAPVLAIAQAALDLPQPYTAGGLRTHGLRNRQWSDSPVPSNSFSWM